MSGAVGLPTSVVAIALALLAGGCAHEPRFLAGWYVTPDACERPVTILLVNHGQKATAVTKVALNAPGGLQLDGVTPSHPVVPGETLELHPISGKMTNTCGRTAAPSAPPPPAEKDLHCLPIRLFVTTADDQKRPRQVDIDRPLPNAFAKEAFVSCH